MRALPTLGGNNGFATGANNRGQVVGWAENTVRDSTCVAPQVLQFKAVVWDLRRDHIEVEELPLLPGDTSGAATAIKLAGEGFQVVGGARRLDRLREVMDEIFGLGPIEPLMKDPEVSDILVNTWKQVIIERHGKLLAVKVEHDHLVRLRNLLTDRDHPMSLRQLRTLLERELWDAPDAAGIELVLQR